MENAIAEANRFLTEETAFHLGMLMTEQAHPKTRGLSDLIARDLSAGIRQLQQVDEDVVVAARRAFADASYVRLVQALQAALLDGKRICFSGCGATGRLSILLEAMYRKAWARIRALPEAPVEGSPVYRAGNAVCSLMTAGDYALVRAVEGFEDYDSFGRQQVTELGLGAGDVLVAVSEGGETSSVIGTAWQALADGAQVFFVCNNPHDVLRQHIERSRRILEEPGVVSIDLSSGPMAIAGSTRMQATTAELLVLGAALETALLHYVQQVMPPEIGRQLGVDQPVSGLDYTTRFTQLLKSLAAPAAVDGMAKWVLWEEAVYREQGAVTYFGNDLLLDIFTDTTERGPTFALPPFRKEGDTQSVRSWAFVKNPLYETPLTWDRMLGRAPRCLAWNSGLYRQLQASDQVIRQPPDLSSTELLRYHIGSEADPSRCSGPADCATLVVGGEESQGGRAGRDLRRAFEQGADAFTKVVVVAIGPVAWDAEGRQSACHIPVEADGSCLRLWERLAAKLVLNTVSTVTAARLGRVTGNWMSHVETTNKKLIDRGTRLVAELAGLSYAEACLELHISRAELAGIPPGSPGRVSPVAATLARLGKNQAGGDTR